MYCLLGSQISYLYMITAENIVQSEKHHNQLFIFFLFVFYDYFPTSTTVNRMNRNSSPDFHLPERNTFIFLTNLNMDLYEIYKTIRKDDCL